VRHGDEVIDIGLFLGHGEGEVADVTVSVGVDVVGLNGVKALLLTQLEPVGHDRFQRFVRGRDRR
jgi:hypothetical protein